MGEGEGEGGMVWENGIETCIISCMKRVASPGSIHDTGCLGLVHWDDPEIIVRVKIALKIVYEMDETGTYYTE